MGAFLSLISEAEMESLLGDDRRCNQYNMACLARVAQMLGLQTISYFHEVIRHIYELNGFIRPGRSKFSPRSAKLLDGWMDG